MKRRPKVIENRRNTAPIPENISNKTINIRGDAIQNGFQAYVSTVVKAALIVGFLVAIFYLYNAIRRYMLAKAVKVVIDRLRPSSSTVGETLTCRIRFRKTSGEIIRSDSPEFLELEENIKIEPTPITTTIKHPVAVLQEFHHRRSHITAKFSLRKSGVYEMKIKYHIFYLDTDGDTPFTFEVYPGPVSPKYMDFETHNPHILCLTAGFEQYFKIVADDQYGNGCRIQDINLQKFRFKLFHMGNLLPVDHAFCYHKSTINEESKSTIDVTNTNDLHSVNVCLKIKLNLPGVYTCFLKYDDYEVRGQKLLVCILPDEESELRKLLLNINLPGLLMHSSECRLSLVGDDDGFSDYFVGITANSLVFAKYKIPLRFYPDISFPINGRTKIFYYANQTVDDDTESVTFLVQNGVRQSVRFEIPSSTGRILLVVFGHNQGFQLPKLGISFWEKREALKVQLHSFFYWFSSEKTLRVENGNLIRSTLREVPAHSDDWLLQFKIIFEGAPQANKTCSTVAKTEEWINRLCEEFFNTSCESGMFQHLSGSKLLHPASSKLSRQPVEHYRLAGQILAKSIVETLLRGICTHLNQIRFTRSFLAYILGFPIHFRFLESDEPSFFRNILTIAESDLNGNEYSFTTIPNPESGSNTNYVNLIPNGSDIRVTNANKEHYLNLLAYHRLIHSVQQEVTALRNGFYDVIDKDKLSNFNEMDLQRLISGGCGFHITDLKAHHRVVKEITLNPTYMDNAIERTPINTEKLLNWFWIAAANLSEEEQSYLIFFTTGSFSLPSCGLADLNPLFTISLTGTFNKHPRAHPTSNEIILSDHKNFESFERSLLFAIKPESERIILPTSNMIALQRSPKEKEFQEDDEDENVEETDSQHKFRAQQAGDVILNWFIEQLSY